MKSKVSSLLDRSAQTKADGLFLPGRIFADIKLRLSLGEGRVPAAGVRLRPWAPSNETLPLHAAAVLIGLVAYPNEVTVILTQRSASLPVHAGQVAFPGGKIEASDASPAAAAVREAYEEIGLHPRHVELLGYLDPYLTGTGFRIVPVVARIEPPFVLELNRGEVEDCFEVPFAFLMDEANHALTARKWEGRTRVFYAMPYAERNIWGATAGILRNLYERLYT